MNACDYWRLVQQRTRAHDDRIDPDRERHRWRAMAAGYDRNAIHTSAPDFPDVVAAHVEPGETVFEIGPGTGAFTVPVARRAAAVVAVDLSEAMLDALQHRLAGEGITNVTAHQGDWPEVEAPQHDVVLAVNSLYRVEDGCRAVRAMTAAARRLVVVGWSLGHNPPVLPSLVDPDGPRRYQPGITYAHLLMLLHEHGITPELRVYHIPRAVRSDSYEDAAARLLTVPDPTPAERAAAETLAREWFQPEGDEVVHHYTGQVAVITWPGGGAA